MTGVSRVMTILQNVAHPKKRARNVPKTVTSRRTSILKTVATHLGTTEVAVKLCLGVPLS